MTDSIDEKTSPCGDWEEDFQHENGNYQCRCAICKNAFFGHKRRVICKTCDDKNKIANRIAFSKEHSHSREDTALVKELGDLAFHLEQLDSESGEAKLLRRTISAIRRLYQA